MKGRILYFAPVLVLSLVFSTMGYVWLINSPESHNDIPSEKTDNYRPDPTDEGIRSQYYAPALFDENGDISATGLSDAIEQRDRYLLENQATDGFGDAGTATGIKWLPAGPQNVGGRTRAIVVDPENHDIIYAGAATGGVWKSVDGGHNWTAMNTKLQNYSVTAIAMDPANRKILYVGTGEGFTGVGLRGGGVFKTSDSGMTWEQLSVTKDHRWAYVSSIAVAHYNDSTIVLAAIEGGEGGSFPHRGIMRSADGGTTWDRVKDGFAGVSVAFDPASSANAIASVSIGNSVQVFWSDDAGESWVASNLGTTATPLPSPSPYVTNTWDNTVEFAYHPGSPSTIYAQHNGSGTSVISKSVDGGQNFTTHETMGGTPGGVGSYTSVLWVSPLPSANLIIGGNGYLWRSTDEANSFETYSIGNGYFIEDNPHQDMQFAVNDPGYDGSTNKRVYIGTDGGVYKTDDISTATGFHPDASPTPIATSGWQQLNETYQTTQFYSTAGDSTSGIIYGGTQDNGTLRLNSGDTDAIYIIGGDGGKVDVDGTYCYGQGGVANDQYGHVWRVSSCGSSSPSGTLITGSISDYSDMGVWLAPIIIDPNDSNRQRAFFGAKFGLEVYKCKNGHTTDMGKYKGQSLRHAYSGWYSRSPPD